MNKYKYFVRITYNQDDKEKLLPLMPGVGVSCTDTTLEYWVYETDPSTICNDIKNDFKAANKELLFERIKVEIMDIDENRRVKQ